jgi:hypothetical protein
VRYRQTIETYHIQLRDKRQRPQDDKARSGTTNGNNAVNQVSVTVSMER